MEQNGEGMSGFLSLRAFEISAWTIVGGGAGASKTVSKAVGVEATGGRG
jgi:hypothetical protein